MRLQNNSLKVYFVVICFVVLLQIISCHENSDVIKFQPINKNEHLGFDKLKAEVLWDIQLYAEDANKQLKRNLYLFNKYEGIAFNLITNDEIFFTRREDNEKTFIYHVDGKTGTVRALVEASPIFAVTPNGKYICFYETWDMMNSNGRKTTNVYLYDVKKNKILEEYDFSKTSTILLNVNKIYFSENEKCFITEIGYDETIVERKIFMIPKDK